MERFLQFDKDLIADGYKLIGWSAPLISILFTVAKLNGWLEWIGFQDLSYAWAFLPLTFWFFIAYLRRWQQYKTLESERDQLKKRKYNEAKLDELSTMFDHGNNKILNDKIKDDAYLIAWIKIREKWAEEVEDYLEEHFGLAERNNFRNVVSYRIEMEEPYSRQRSLMVRKLEMLRETIIRYSDKLERSGSGLSFRTPPFLFPTFWLYAVAGPDLFYG